IVVCEPDKIKKNHIEGAPDFIVEVLSPSTKRRDVTIKKDIYEKYGVKEYWIISPKEESIEVYILHNGKYELDNIYHNFDEEDWNALSEAEKAEQQLSVKINLYDDLEVLVKDVFE
ncbi:MAG: Uma2 family endonuclease, partial [Butyrivibrio sp.]|nr:Uma2 family endonuclease [Butyrivibrio sp.]